MANEYNDQQYKTDSTHNYSKKTLITYENNLTSVRTNFPMVGHNYGMDAYFRYHIQKALE